MLGWYSLEWLWSDPVKIAFCIGNGESRTGLDLEQFKQYGTLYGANAVYRDTTVDNLICCDKRMVKEALHNNYSGTIYTRPDWYNEFATPQVRYLPSFAWSETSKWTKHFHWGSGLHAVHLACKQNANICVMIGHDFYSTNGKHNNIYKDTSNYESSDHHAIDHSHWVLQFGILFAYYPQTTFIFCQPNINTWKVPSKWDILPMVMLQNTKDMINDLHLTQG